jgi:23S rRNA pseudouridine2604 synthase
MKLRNNFKERMEGGVVIDEEVTKPCKVNVTSDHSFKVILGEGKKHQIRRMCSALFNEVSTLRRTRIMNIELGGLAAGHMRMLKGEELATFLKSLGL